MLFWENILLWVWLGVTNSYVGMRIGDCINFVKEVPLFYLAINLCECHESCELA